MLKLDIKSVFFILLFLQIEWSEAVGYVIPIICGLIVNTGREIKNKSLTARGFLVKIMYVSGLSPMVYFVYKAFNIEWDISITLFAVTFLSDTIVTQGYKAGDMGVANYFASIFNKSKQYKDDE